MRLRVNTGEKGVPDRFIAILIVVILISASVFSVWYLFVRPISIDELAMRDLVIKDGDVIKVGGRISNVERLNTTYGEITVLTLNGSELSESAFKFIGNNSRTYHIGDYFTTTLHFQNYTFNNKTVITAPELYFPFMYLFNAIQTVSSAVSFSTGFGFVSAGSDSNGMTYKVFGTDNGSYPLTMLNLSLRKSTFTHNYSGVPDNLKNGSPGAFSNAIFITAREYMNVNDAFRWCDEIDYMASLSNDSQNGLVEFTDANSDNLFDDGDMFRINIPPTDDIHTIETYFLCIQGPGVDIYGMDNYQGLFRTEKYIVNWYDGPYELKNGDSTLNYLALSYVSDRFINGTYESIIEVTGVTNPVVMRYDNCVFRVTLYKRNSAWDPYGNDYFDGPFSEDGVTDEKTGATVRFIDSNNNSLVDAGDFVGVSGLENGTAAELWINHNTKQPSGRIQWYAGYGHVSGNMPDISLNNSKDGDQCVVSVGVPYWHPELEFNRTVRFSLKNSSGYIIENQTLEDGRISSGPLNVTFADADENRYLSDGDYFVLSDYGPTPPCNYTLSVSVLFENYVYEINLSSSNG